MHSAAQSLRVQKIVAGVSTVLFLVKFFAWYITNSVAILTDALESIVNVLAGLVGVYSLTVSSKPRDRDHPYGHGKVEFVTAAFEGVMITLAGLIIIYESVTGFFHERTIQKIDSGLLLIAATAIVNYIAGVTCVRVGRKNNSLALIAGGKHLITDTYTTVGILAGLTLLYFTGWLWIDKVVAIIFAFVILFTGYRIIRSSIAGIMDETDETMVKELIEMLQQERRVNWIDLHNLRIIKYGPTLHLDCHLTVPWYFNVNEAHREVDMLDKLVKDKYGSSVEMFIHTDGCIEFSCAICSKGDCNVRKHPFIRSVKWDFNNITGNVKHHAEIQ